LSRRGSDGLPDFLFFVVGGNDKRNHPSPIRRLAVIGLQR
jgi:hypothetical protein